MKLKTLTFLLIFLSLPAVAQISVMSYNIRLATESDGENAWSQRKEYLTSQVVFYEPGIMGVQEALPEQLEFLDEELEQYRYIGVGRDGERKGEFSAIFYNSDLFEMLDNDTFWLSETPERISRGWDAALNRICTYGRFREKASGKEFYVFNTHFDHKGEVARLKSAELIVDKIKEVNSDGLPVVLMGDLNLPPSSPSLVPIQRYLNDSRAVASEAVFGPEGTFNGFKFGEPVGERIDYVFTSEGIKVLKYGVLTDSKELKYPSDHFPVLVVFKLKA